MRHQKKIISRAHKSNMDKKGQKKGFLCRGGLPKT